MLACPAGHCFDIAREGYVNLLPPQHRIRGMDGDTAPMLRARRRFLQAGHFAPLLDLLAGLASAALGDTPPVPSPPSGPCVLDVGCGEGYYIGGIAARFGATPGTGPRPSFLGMDLSKAAARMAARRYPGVTFLVGDVNRRICLPDASASLLLNVFSPRNPAEFERIVVPGGLGLIAIPEGRHLRSLREGLGLLDIPEDKERRLLEKLAGFRLVDRRALRYPLTLPPPAVNDLVAMSPNAWHRPDEPSLPDDAPPVTTEAAFLVLVLERMS
jgi:23S rRNA (guanine745-N1)-methyltransferase